jgi:flagellar hook-associated protein 2
MAGMQLSGLASGVDTASIVEQLMALEARGKTRLTMRQSSFSAQKTALTDLKAKLDALKSAAADLRSSTTWAENQTVESSDAARVAVARTGGAPIGGYSVKVTQLASSAQKTYSWTQDPAASQLTFDDGDALTNPVTIDVAANAKITDVASAINGRGDLPVYAAVVGGDKLVLSSRATGAPVAFSAAGSQLTHDPAKDVAGRSAEYELDGVPQTPSATNTIETAIPGVRLTLKGTTTDAVSINVGAPGVDRTKVKDEIKQFVEAYNAVVTATRAKIGEKKIQDPSTQSDYNKGAFFGDTGLNSMLSKLRGAVGKDYVPGDELQLDSLRDIGISTGKPGASTAGAKAGLLEIDDAKLTAALEADAQAVRNLFGGTATTFAKDIEQLSDDLSDVLDGRIQSTEKQSKRIAADLLRADSRLEAKEKRLKAQFARMEAAMGASQTQQAWLAGQISGLPSWGG